VKSGMWKSIVRAVTGKEADAPESIISDNASSNVSAAISSYMAKFDEKDLGRDEDKIKERQDEYKSLVTDYYSLVSDMYEHGWVRPRSGGSVRWWFRPGN